MSRDKPTGTVDRLDVNVVKDGSGFKVCSEIVFARTRTEEEAKAEAKMLSIGLFDKDVRSNGGRLAVNMSRELRNLGFGPFDEVYLVAFGKPVALYDANNGENEDDDDD